MKKLIIFLLLFNSIFCFAANTKDFILDYRIEGEDPFCEDRITTIESNDGSFIVIIKVKDGKITIERWVKESSNLLGIPKISAFDMAHIGLPPDNITIIHKTF